MRIAWVGGTPGHFTEGEIAPFFQKVRRKYPDAIHVVGSAKGAEAQIKELCDLTEVQVEVPELHPSLRFDPSLQVCNVIAEADVILCVGTRGGGRVRLALEIVKRVDTCRQPYNKRKVHHLAEPPVKAKATPKRRATKKVERD